MSDHPYPLPELLAAFDAFTDLLATFDDHQWQVESLCPGWDNRDIAIHIAGIEDALSGHAPGAFVDAVPFHQIVDFAASAASLNDADLLARVQETLQKRAAEVRTYTAEDMDKPSMTPVGRKTYGRFMEIRIFDIWVHEQDMRRPLGLPGHDSGPVAEVAINEIVGSMPYIAGKLIGLPDGSSMRINLTGPVERTIDVAVDGRAALVDELTDPTVTLDVDSTTFALLACGRIDPEVEISEATITWTGDDELGGRAARSLRFTM